MICSFGFNRLCLVSISFYAYPRLACVFSLQRPHARIVRIDTQAALAAPGTNWPLNLQLKTLIEKVVVVGEIRDKQQHGFRETQVAT